MMNLMNSPELAKSMGATGRERAVRDLDWQKKIQQVISIYRSLPEKSDVSPEFEESPASAAAVSQHR